MNAFFGSCRECDSKQAIIDALQAEVERYKLQEAQRLSSLNRNPEAAAIFRVLKARRDAEKDRADSSGDAARAAAAEYTSLSIHQELARVLTRERNFNDAESIMRHVWTQRKELMPSDQPAIRSAQLDLCVILTSQGNPSKNREAEMLHRAEWQLHEDVAPGGGLGVDHSWIIKNGHLLGMLLHRKGAQDEAMLVLRSVLGYCVSPSKETNEIISSLVAFLLDSARRDEALGQPLDARPKLNEVERILTQRLLQPNSQIDPTELESVIAIARMIDQKDAHDLSEPLRRHIHAETVRIYGAQSPQAFKTGWALASSLSVQRRAGEARPLVESLLRAKTAEFDRSEAVRMLRQFLSQPGAERERMGQPMDRRQGSSSRSHRSGGHPISRGASGQGDARVSLSGTSPPVTPISPRLRETLAYIAGGTRQ